MAKKPCTFLNKGCAFGKKNACTEKETGKCGEGIRRRALAQKPCPIMISLGRSGPSAQCDNADLRAQVPNGMPCHINDKCIRELSEDVQKHFYDKASYAKLRKPIQKTLKALQA